MAGFAHRASKNGYIKYRYTQPMPSAVFELPWFLSAYRAGL